MSAQRFVLWMLHLQQVVSKVSPKIDGFQFIRVHIVTGQVRPVASDLREISEGRGG